MYPHPAVDDIPKNGFEVEQSNLLYTVARVNTKCDWLMCPAGRQVKNCCPPLSAVQLANL
jgi:hypothetical protein